MLAAAPTPRWAPCTLGPRQRAFWQSTSAINAVPACRRSWKTEGAKRRLIRRALSPSPLPSRRYFACGPTQEQSRAIFLDDLVALLPVYSFATGNPDKDVSLSNLEIRLRNGVILKIAGLDRPSRIEGGFWDGGIIDEYADCRADVFEQHILPMMARPGSYVDLVGSPAGRNHWYTMVQRIKAGELGDAAHFTWKASEVLHLYLGHERAEAVLAQAKATMDPDTYAQEMEGAWTSPNNQVYYNFDASTHAVEPLPYDPNATLYIGFDFNISPGVAVVCQKRLYRGDNPKVDRTGPVSMVIDEVWISTNSNTPKVCQELIRRYGAHEGDVVICADATGGNGHSSQIEGSDIDLIEKYLSPVFGKQAIPMSNGKTIRLPSRLSFDVPRGNPAVRARTNAVNSRLLTADGVVHALIDPKCKHLIRDLEGVQHKKGTGDIDKVSESELSHMSDAWGYYISKQWPIREIIERWQTI